MTNPILTLLFFVYDFHLSLYWEKNHFTIISISSYTFPSVMERRAMKSGWKLEGVEGGT